jgi:cytochrome c
MKSKKASFFIGSVLSLILSTQAQASECDLVKGEKTFTKCTACHSLEPNTNLMGPSLHGLMNRGAGEGKNFQYSNAMMSSNIEWSPTELNEFLLNPKKKIPGTSMPFSGLRNAKARAAVTCYLEHETNKEKS